MQKKPDRLSGLITARSPVMTPLLLLHIILVLFGSLLIYRSIVIGTIFIFIFWAPILLYTIWRHEQWAEKAPWLLASEKVTLHDSDLYGTSEKLVSERDALDLEAVPNPNQKLPKANPNKSKVPKG